ncbi:MAG: hypothetical protein RQ757_13485 [Pseudomonadales bacterium]|nr:hypothetical protein [Pseudomonadales bacterium]
MRRHCGPVHRVLAGALLVLMLSACSVLNSEIDLQEIYARQAAELERITPVIIIPGVMGSRLVNAAGTEYWPGSSWNLATRRSWDHLGLPVAGMSPVATEPLQAQGLFDQVLGQDFYRQLVSALEDSGPYECQPANEWDGQANCLLFAWDWRDDFVKAAAELDRLVETIRRQLDDADLKVDLVAHSAGGLVARYYARYGGVDVLTEAEVPGPPAPWHNKVRNVVLIGTPNFGSVSALQQALMGESMGLLGRLSPAALATMNSMYQLLPHPDRAWMIGIDGLPVDRDLYDLAFWKESRWSIFDPAIRQRLRSRFADPDQAEAYLQALEAHMAAGLERGQRFHRALSLPLGESTASYVAFGSGCKLTPALCLLEEVNGEIKIHLWPEDIINPDPQINYQRLMLAPGDGRVTKSSLTGKGVSERFDDGLDSVFPLSYSVFVCAEHAQLPSDPTFRDNLLDILLVE